MSESQAKPESSPVDSPAAIPQAIIQTAQQVAVGRLKTRLWWLTAVCALLAIGLIVSSYRAQGRPIRIQFSDGYGLKVGDTLRYRGIDVGAVSGVVLAQDLQSVDVNVLLAPGHENIAVEGSRFWIQRARLRLGEVTGLDTVLGANYLGVIPGAAGAKLQREFVGLETPLAMNSGDSAEIAIQFPAGEGLQTGDQVRYRGIGVGEVTYVELSERAEEVKVGVRLVGAARQFARSGTQFWIERPRLDLTEVRGLETLIAGRYITFQSTLQESAPQREFVGLADPPPMPRRDGDLEIELDATRRLGLVRGAPIIYRGLEVGRVANVNLSKDGASVKVAAIIDTEYSELVRVNSKWWAVGGIEFDAGLRGVKVSVESLSAWIRGGIAFATPPEPGDKVVTGHRFMLEPQPQPDWLEWQPRIAVGNYGKSATGLDPPTPIRVVASWQSSWLGLYRRRTAQAWGLPLDDGSLRVPASFLQKARAADTAVTIEVAGKSLNFDPTKITANELSGAIALPNSVAVERWPRKNLLGNLPATTTLLVMNPELSEPLAIDQTRVSNIKDGDLSIAPGVTIPPTLDGSAVVDSASGKVIGLLVQREEGWFVSRLR